MMETPIARFHLHPIIDHFIIALLATEVLADLLASLCFAPLRHRREFLARWHDRRRVTGLQLLVAGALAAMLSRFTGEREAERLWDTMSPVAQQLLWSDAGAGRFLSHAMLGTYLMYAFLVLAAWRVLQEISRLAGRTRPLYLAVALMGMVALLYQGKTGGELVLQPWCRHGAYHW
jgi:uncharacterized membrane protein